jgi:hypothetical protein
MKGNNMGWLVPAIIGVLLGYAFHDVLKRLIDRLKR